MVGDVTRRITTIVLIAALLPAPGLAWPVQGGASVVRPQIYLVFNVDVPVLPAGSAIAMNAGWVDELMKELAAAPEPAESILDQIDAGNQHVLSLPSATGLASMPDTLPFERNPNGSVPAERSMSVAMTDALQEAGFDTTQGGTRYEPGSGVVTYEGENNDGDIIVTGRLVDGHIELTKEFKPLTGGGNVGDGVRIRSNGTSTPTVAAPSNTAATSTLATPTTPVATTTSAAAPTVIANQAQPVQAAPGVRIVPTGGAPGDSVFMSEGFRVEATRPLAGAPLKIDATLTTPDGRHQTVTLTYTGSQNGVATYSSDEVSIDGGRLAPGTIKDLELTNGQILLVTAAGAQGGVLVYTDDVQQGIARNTEALNATSEDLIRQRSFIDGQMRDPSIASDPAAMQTLTEWRADIDKKLSFISQTRQVVAGADQPGLQFMLGQRRLEWMHSHWDEWDLRQFSGVDYQVHQEFKEKKTEMFTGVMTAFTMGAYQHVVRSTMVAQIYTLATGTNEFNRQLTPEELAAEKKGLALDLAMAWVPGKFMEYLENGGHFSGEFVISGGSSGTRTALPSRGGRTSTRGRTATTESGRPTTTAGAKPPVVSPTAAGDVATAPATPARTPTAFREDPAIPQVDRGLDGTPGAPVTRVADRDVGPTEHFDAEMLKVYNTNVTRARAAGVQEATIKQIIGDGEPTAAKTELLYREAIAAEGNINIPRSEFVALAGINVRSQTGGLSEADYQFLGNRLAQDPTYIDSLPNRGRMPQEAGVGDGFRDIFTPAQRDTLLKDPRVAQMVADAKSAAAASGTVILDPNQTTFNPNQTVIVAPNDPISLPPGTQRGVAGVADATGTVIVPRNTQSSTGTPTVRDPNVTTLDPNQTTINPNQTVIIDPNKTSLMPAPGAQPGVAAVAENTGTVIIPRGAKPSPGTSTVRDPNVTRLDPNKTTIDPNKTVITDPNKTSLMPPPNSPTRVDPNKTVRMDPNATALITNELMQSLPKAQQAGRSPKDVATDLRATMTKLGVSPKQLVNTLAPKLLSRVPKPVSMADLGNTTTAPANGLNVSIEALGISSGEAFRMTAVNNAAAPMQLQGEGIIVEPIIGASVKQTTGASSVGVAAPVVTQTVEAFCLERVRPVAPPGTQYRVAPQALQQQHHGLVDVLHAAQRVQSTGLLHPDSEIKGYFNFVRQWSIWTKQENFDEKKFTEEFLNQTKKNVESQNVKWTDAMQSTVRKAAPGRWRDITSVLDEANKPKIQAAAGAPLPSQLLVNPETIDIAAATATVAAALRRRDHIGEWS